MTVIRIATDPRSWLSAQRFAEDHGLARLGQKKLATMADDAGVVHLDELQRLARVAAVDDDGVLSRAEAQRVSAYVRDRRAPIVGSANSSAVTARAVKRAPVTGYIAIDHRAEGKDLVFTLDISKHPGTGEYAKRIVLEGVAPNERDDATAVSVERYGTRGENASAGYARGGAGAGYIVGIADKDKGAILVNLSAAGALAGDAPDARTLFTPAALARHPAVQTYARKHGLDPRAVHVEVLEVSFHSDFVDRSRGPRASHAGLHTLLLSLELTQEGSRKEPRRVEMSALVEGNVTEPLAKLDVEHLEPGAKIVAGFVYPSAVTIA